MTIVNSTIEDMDTLQQLFDKAIQYQRSKSVIPWVGMNRELIENEIGEGIHWKIVEDGLITCFFSATYNDRMVWDDRDADPSIYLHRIVTNPEFRGKGYVKHIVAWAEDFGRSLGKRFIRLDTNRINERLNEYYRDCGFALRGYKQFDEGDPAVPRHYLGPGLSLYEKEIC